MGFQDTFGKDNQGEQNLQYDDAAFYYFTFSMIAILLIPLSISTIRQVFKYKVPKRNCPCQQCIDKVKIIKKSNSFKWFDKWFILKVLIITFMVFLQVKMYEQLSQIKTIKSFDPFEILEVPEDADIKAIKKAYRMLTLKYHPDKNKDDPQATAKFILISKAYEVLTDDKVKANYEKFGSPDGPGKMQVGIALPSFFLNKKNHVAILAFFFIILLIILPSIIIYWYSDSVKYDIDGIRLDNKQKYYQVMNENILIKSLPEVLCLSDEFNIPVRSMEQNRELIKLENLVVPNLTKPRIQPQFRKFLILIGAYLMDFKISSIFEQDLNIMYQMTPSLIDGIIDICQKLRQRGAGYKYMGLRCLIQIIEFKQLFLQGLWTYSDSLSQMEFFTEDNIKRVKRKMKRVPQIHDLINDEDQSKFFLIFDVDEQNQIKKQLSYFPKVKFDGKVFVKGEDEIYVGDIISLEITFERLNNLINNQAQFVHSLKYPLIIKESWYVIICHEEQDAIIHFEEITSQKATHKIDFPFPAQKAGKFIWTIYLMSACYKGLDQKIEIEIKILPDQNSKKEVFVHPEDRELDKQPSFFQSLMKDLQQENSDDELEDEFKKDKADQQEKKDK